MYNINMKDITPEESVSPIYLVPLTEEEILQRKEMQLEQDKRMQEELDKLKNKESAIAKLLKLGITEEEAKAIAGV